MTEITAPSNGWSGPKDPPVAKLGIRPGRRPLAAETRCGDPPNPHGATAAEPASPVRHDDRSTRVIISPAIARRNRRSGAYHIRATLGSLTHSSVNPTNGVNAVMQ